MITSWSPAVIAGYLKTSWESVDVVRGQSIPPTDTVAPVNPAPLIVT